MTPLPLFVPWLIALIAVLLIGGLLWSRSRHRSSASRPLPTKWPLSARPLFRPDERRTYRRLREALPRHLILGKLPLVRFCHPDDPGDVRYWYELLGTIQVSFCLCSSSGRVLAVLDLQRRNGESRRTSEIKQAVLAACQIRYIQCSFADLPSVAELQRLVPPLAETSRGSAPAQARGRGAAAQRAPIWQDSSLFPDSFFGDDSRNDHESTSDFAALRGLEPRGIADGAPDDIVGVVVDTPPAPPPR